MTTSETKFGCRADFNSFRRELSRTVLQQPCPQCDCRDTEPLRLNDAHDREDDDIVTMRCCRACGNVFGYDDTTSSHDDTCPYQPPEAVLSSADGAGGENRSWSDGAGGWKSQDDSRSQADIGYVDRAEHFGADRSRRDDAESGRNRNSNHEPEMCSGFLCDGDGSYDHATTHRKSGHASGQPDPRRARGGRPCEVCRGSNPEVMIHERNAEGWVTATRCPQCDRTVSIVDDEGNGRNGEHGGEMWRDDDNYDYNDDHRAGSSPDTGHQDRRVARRPQLQQQSSLQKITEHLVTDLGGAMVQSGQRVYAGIQTAVMQQCNTNGTTAGVAATIGSTAYNLATAEVTPLSAAVGRAVGSTVALGLSGVGVAGCDVRKCGEIGERMGTTVGQCVTGMMASSQRRREDST